MHELMKKQTTHTWSVGTKGCEIILQLIEGSNHVSLNASTLIDKAQIKDLIDTLLVIEVLL
jgi:hypothetical protein